MNSYPIFRKTGKGRDRFTVGYMNADGRTLIEPGYQDGDWPFDGMISFKSGNKWGYLADDAMPTIAIPPQFDGAGRFSEGKAVVAGRGKGKVAFLDKAGRLAPCQDLFGDLQEGLALILSGERYGFVDSEGEVRIPATFDDARDFSDGLAPVKKGKRWGYINRHGQFECEPRFDFALPFNSGLARVQIGKLFGFVNRSFAEVINPRWSMVYDFRDGLAPVQENGRFGFINTGGDFVVKPSYDGCSGFSEGMAIVRRAKKAGEFSLTGFINSDGVEVIPLAFRSATPFYRGLALVGTEKEIQYINRDGSVIWSGPALNVPHFIRRPVL